MDKNWLTRSSFTFGGVDMYAEFGIQLTDDGLPKDVLIPGLRSRKQQIPQRHGAYDYGAEYYDERSIGIRCVTTRILTRADTREIAYALSKKAELRTWNEPDKYYIGRIYQAPDLEQLRTIGNRFPLIFICDPFAYGETKTEQMPSLVYLPKYRGTAATPTYIVIENIGETAAVNIQITQTNRKEVI